MGEPECGGTQNNGDVIAAASKGVFVNYKKLLGSQNGIPWVAAARSVVAKLDEIQYIAQKATTLVSAANYLEQQKITTIAKRPPVDNDAYLYGELVGGSSFDNCLTLEAMIRNPSKTVDHLSDEDKQIKTTYFGTDNNLLTDLADSIAKTNARGTQTKAATTKKLSELDDLGLLHKAVAYESAELASTLIFKQKKIESFRKANK
uniref:Variant surface glycoprotein n=1 Tax=Trypanosoma brucei TaxID=5691 RepID=A0A1V0FYJ5_9TRYP|nr:variant surface glycoprotein [Trypanosoma brucei]